MADAQQGMMEGKNRILFIRNLKNAADESAKKPLYQTSHTFSLSRDSDSITTKDGTIVKIGELEAEFSGIEGVVSKGSEVLTVIQDALLNGEMLELWEVSLDQDLEEDGTYPAVYVRGYMTNFELEASAEDEATYSGDFSVELNPQFGFTPIDEDVASDVQYAFRTTEPATGGVEG